MTIFFKGIFFVIIASFILMVYPVSISSSEQKNYEEKPIVHFGLIPIYTPQLMYERFQPLMDYLTMNTPYRFKMRLTKDYKEIVNLLDKGSINIALLGGGIYTITRDKVGILPILKPLNRHGNPFYKSIIVTREDKDINKLSDIRGKSIAFGSRWSTSSSIIPIYHLYTKGIGLNGISTYFHLRYSDSVAREVLKGSYDAGAIMDTTADIYKDKGLKFIFISEPIPALPIVVRMDAPVELINAVKKALLKINPSNPLHKDMLEEWGEEIRYGFVEAKDSDYDEIEGIIKYLKRKGVYFQIDEH